MGHQQRDLGPLLHAIPRGNGASRDYGFLLAWREAIPGDVIVALDDDCIVEEGWPEAALHALSQNRRPVVAANQRHWNVLDLYEGTPAAAFPRGFPYSARVTYKAQDITAPIESEPVFHLGLWRGVSDVNAIDKLQGPPYEHSKARLRTTSVIAPPGMLGSAWSMNMIFRREVIPAVYQLPMAVDVLPGWRIDHYGDIWGGFIAKTLMDAREEMKRLLRHAARRTGRSLHFAMPVLGGGGRERCAHGDTCKRNDGAEYGAGMMLPEVIHDMLARGWQFHAYAVEGHA